MTEFEYLPGDVLANDWLSEDGSVEDGSDGSIGRFPHLLQFEFFDSLLIWGDRGAFDSHLVLQDGIGAVDGDLRR